MKSLRIPFAVAMAASTFALVHSTELRAEESHQLSGNAALTTLAEGALPVPAPARYLLQYRFEQNENDTAYGRDEIYGGPGREFVASMTRPHDYVSAISLEPREFDPFGVVTDLFGPHVVSHTDTIFTGYSMRFGVGDDSFDRVAVNYDFNNADNLSWLQIDDEASGKSIEQPQLDKLDFKGSTSLHPGVWTDVGWSSQRNGAGFDSSYRLSVRVDRLPEDAN